MFRDLLATDTHGQTQTIISADTAEIISLQNARFFQLKVSISDLQISIFGEAMNPLFG